MKWFRLHSEIKDDPKMLELEDSQFRTWINLLAMANEADERGVIPAHRPRGLATALHTTVESMEESFTLFAELGMIERREDGSILLTHFIKRQYDNPSDQPEKVAERKARLKERQQNADKTPAQTENGPADTENDKRTTKERQKNDTYSDSDTEHTQTKKDPHTPETGGVMAFEIFWQAYPRKDDKEKGRKAWLRLHATPLLLETILSAIEMQKQSDQWQRGIIPLPATWLNGKRWADESMLTRTSSARASPMSATQTVAAFDDPIRRAIEGRKATV